MIQRLIESNIKNDFNKGKIIIGAFVKNKRTCHWQDI